MPKPKDNKSEDLDLDSILVEVGSFGKYQTMTYALIQLPILFSAVFASQYIFAAGGVDYRCLVPECESTDAQFKPGEWGEWALPKEGGRCERWAPVATNCTAASFSPKVTETCSSWVYEAENTIVAEFDLACEDWKRTLVGTVHNAGVFAALAITAIVSDAYGRKSAFIITAISSGFVGIIRSFVNNYVVYVVLEFMDAFVGAGVYSTGFILALEMVGLKHRVFGGNIISCTFALGQVLTAVLAWAFPHWRTLTRVLYTPVLLFGFYYFIIEESVRWLLSKGRKKEAARIIFKAAAINKKKLSPATIKLLTEEPQQVKKSEHEVEELNELQKPSIFMQVIKSKTLMSRMFVVSFWWITITFIYYGLSINSVSLAGNMYLNFILTSLVEIPGYFVSFLTLDRFGRKSSIITAFFICGLSLIAIPFIPSELSWLQITLNMVGKLTISMAFSSIYIYTSELFPTEARHSMLGACSMCGRIGSMLAPQTPLLVANAVIALSMVGKLAISMVFTSIYIYTIELFPTYARHSCMNTCSMVGRVGSMAAPQTPLLMTYMESLPYLIFGIMAATSGLLMLFTPETLRMRLPDTVAQAENIAVAPRTKKPTDIIVD